jgi:Protein of unknown function (DUF2778)
MWKYVQSTGALVDPAGKILKIGYSGRVPDGKNQPDKQNVADVGPIPRGWWTIGAPFTHENTGKITMRLTADESTELFGRGGFLIHGDNKTGTASTGCIVIGGGPYRQRIWDSGDHRLQVVRDSGVVTAKALSLAKKTRFVG